MFVFSSLTQWTSTINSMKNRMTGLIESDSLSMCVCVVFDEEKKVEIISSLGWMI